ncbi:TadE/TadG family type IV pilus assembly protein [Sphingosinithalassobacter sp. CS137]|uniref:TadE/TadG family type IV pilus assembly protein n=1 Tax=Sphingosinithalassobacter sp. CS137 TaxID=2762748 RepID=UPI0021CEC4FC|nr:TadE/TadG family type IV pilus assembly protein [Sphingosinithalassobacter sp. CS137]
MADARAWLTALVRDTRANTIAIMAMAMIPLAGMVGGGVDISRMYIVKTRLQHACDAGALAGRKSMGAGVWSYNNYWARGVAEKFFDANISATPYGASNLTRSFSEQAGKVIGTASATVPMTLMRIFGRTSETLTVTCDAEMRLPNTDVMFVLDVTGSMASRAVSSDSDTKIESLRTAVKCFYEIVARLDTDAMCTHGQPAGGTGDQVQIRFGFVPYNTNVNVGRLLSPDWFANEWKYQSREPVWHTETTTTYPNPIETDRDVSNNTSAWSPFEDTSTYIDWWGGCPAIPTPNPGTQVMNGTTTTSDPVIDPQTGVKTWTETTVNGTLQTQYRTVKQGWGDIRCMLQKSTRTTGSKVTITYSAQPVTTTEKTFQRWRYAQVTHDISGLKDPADVHQWNDTGTVELPIGADGAMRSIPWDGCIEERATVRATNYSPIPSGAYDLNIDLVPAENDPATLWGPALPGAIFTRQATWSSNGSTNGWNSAEVFSEQNYVNNSSYSCPSESRLLQTWPTASAFEDYVDGLTPNGNTYHDIGLIWGARLISPTGLFAASNAKTPKGGDIERHLIFMTDGDTVTSAANYAAYGLPWFDRRQTSASAVPSSGDLTNQVNARFAAMCTAVKNMNITLWVISFGSGSNETTEQRLENCASANRYFVARDSATLQQTFRSIADEISQLRLTR